MTRSLRTAAFAASTLILGAGAVLAATPAAQITAAEVEEAQAAWGEALVRISAAHAEGGIDEARSAAEAVLDSLYAFDAGPVLFKPTLTGGPQTFRTTRDGALSYFVGHDPEFPGDSGFALKGWTDVQIQNAAIHIEGDTALTMGNVLITDASGAVTTVDKTWGFSRDAQGDLRIVLHHSSLPFAVE
ncbi:MAG: phosphoribosyl-AMP cyclohydrolase [Paracoccus hibiscisoli]|uniref:phosphoribosyl-AMP cyclohydrolase n=1 Tax=Paracoccus hibiscisoli TaxID=2023261 RepID=UPI003918B489